MSACLVQVTITAAQGGHSGPVQVLLPFKQFLLSADWLGTLKVWDMASGQCVQTMQQAHKEPIMGVLQWEVSLLPFSSQPLGQCPWLLYSLTHAQGGHAAHNQQQTFVERLGPLRQLRLIALLSWT